MALFSAGFPLILPKIEDKTRIILHILTQRWEEKTRLVTPVFSQRMGIERASLLPELTTLRGDRTRLVVVSSQRNRE